MSEERDEPGPAPGASCGPTRRAVLALSGVGAAHFLLRRPASSAGQAPPDFPIPAEKGLAAAWSRALVERGEPSVARGAELKWIGMPVGGIGCGQLYLAGDGRLWHWDLFNQPCPAGFDSSAGPHYARPLESRSTLDFGFTLQVERRGGGALLPLGRAGFPEVEFRGSYPIGTVTYRSRSPALEIELEAFSPFVPLELEDSSLPATVLRFRLRNLGPEALAVRLRGHLENAVCRWSDPSAVEVERTSRVERIPDPAAGAASAHTRIVHGAVRRGSGSERPDIPFEDFEQGSYAGWTVEGTAFGAGPRAAREEAAAEASASEGAEGARLASSRATDAPTGTLTSREFTIERNWITFLIGGGAHPGATCVELLVDGEVAAAATGANEERLRPHSFFVGGMQGQSARLRIADRSSAAWGHVCVDSIVFSDRQRIETLAGRGDFGTMALAVLGAEGIEVSSEAQLDQAEEGHGAGAAPANEEHALARRLALEPGATAEAVFLVAWHFPNPWKESLAFLPARAPHKRQYAARFADAGAVVSHVAEHHERLARTTRLWRDTWYDSTLPHWFLERTFASAANLATATALRLDDGRFLGWDGAYCRPGTGTPVWHYAQAPARLFPALEREQRERVDLDLAFHPDSGQIDARAEAARDLALDGQAGTILRVYREHTLASDDAFLKRTYGRAKKALELLLARDPDQDGVLDGAQPNALAASWFGASAWTSSLYLAALRAGEAMALERTDAEFAARCRRVLDAGARSLVTRLFNGEYFVHEPDPAHPEAISIGQGCHVDQVLGQAWAHQVGLGRILPEVETRAALAALWKYNFAPDVGPYRKFMESRIPGGRWLAMPGEAGLLQCTWPKGGSERALGQGTEASAAGVFNECLTGCEHQVAAHMLWEGLVEEGLAIERALHDRHHPARRNPYNEVESGDHAARAMASYGVFLAACGFELHGPKAHLGFAPRLAPENFRAAFTAPEGWGSYAQQVDASRALRARLELRHGTLRLRTLRIGHAGRADAKRVSAKLGERVIPCAGVPEKEAVLVRFDETLALRAGQVLEVEGRAG